MKVKSSTVLLALLTCACATNTTPKASPGLTAVDIGYSRLRISLPIFVAKEEGFFKKHGIEARLAMYDTAQPMASALVEGQLSVAGYTALPITYAAMQRSGTKLLFLTAMVEDQQHRVSYLLGKKPSPGEEPQVRSIADLRGKTVGILPTMAYKAWLQVILDKNGVAPGEVVLQQIEPMLQAQMLTSGGVAALFTNDPAATAAIASGKAELITDFVETPRYLGEPFLFGSFNVTKDWADAHPKELAQLAAALDDAIAFIAAYPQKAKLDLRPYLPDAFKPNVESYPDARYLSTAETDEATFAKVAKQYQELGIIPAPVALDGLVWRASPR